MHGAERSTWCTEPLASRRAGGGRAYEASRVRHFRTTEATAGGRHTGRGRWPGGGGAGRERERERVHGGQEPGRGRGTLMRSCRGLLHAACNRVGTEGPCGGGGSTRPAAAKRAPKSGPPRPALRRWRVRGWPMGGRERPLPGTECGRPSPVRGLGVESWGKLPRRPQVLYTSEMRAPRPPRPVQLLVRAAPRRASCWGAPHAGSAGVQLAGGGGFKP